MNSPNHLNQLTEKLLAQNNTAAQSTHPYLAYLRLFWIRRLTESLFCFGLMFASVRLCDGGTGAGIWLFSGVGLSALYLRGPYVLPSVFLGIVFGMPIQHTLMHSAHFAVLEILWMCSIYYGGLYFIGAVTPLSYRSVWFKWLILISVVTGLLTTSLGLPWTFFSQMNGVLCLTPWTLRLSPFEAEHYFKQLWPWVPCSLFLILLHGAYFVTPPQMHLFLAILLGMLIIAYGLLGLFRLGLTLLGISAFYSVGFLETNHNYHIIVQFIFMISTIMAITISLSKQKLKN